MTPLNYGWILSEADIGCLNGLQEVTIEFFIEPLNAAVQFNFANILSSLGAFDNLTNGQGLSQQNARIFQNYIGQKSKVLWLN